MEADEPPVADLSHDHHGTDCRLKRGNRLVENTVITMLSRLEGKEAVPGDVNGRAAAVEVIQRAIDHYVESFCR